MGIIANIDVARPRKSVADIGHLAQRAKPAAHSVLCPSIAFLARHGLARRTLEAASRAALLNQSSGLAEMLASGTITQAAYYATLAQELNVTFVNRDDVTRFLGSGAGERVAPNAFHAFARLRSGRVVMLAAPGASDAAKLLQRNKKRGLPDRLAICAPNTLRKLAVEHGQSALLQNAVDDLSLNAPHLSVRSGPSFVQGIFATLFVLGAVAAFALKPTLTTMLAHMALATFFFGCVILRFLAWYDFRGRPLRPLPPTNPGSLPTYTIIVGLHDEATVVPSLVAGMRRLKWPRSKLQVLFACEADDAATIDALRGQSLEPWFEIIQVPPSEPRTKPKALNYALQFARGAYVTIYDAEDQPHPEQLLEAHAAFSKVDDTVACLQAPLVTSNPADNHITALFHLEYAGLFNGLMPWFDRAGAPILLGGTSNHFRTDILRKVGAWDPFNVTEDADLGLRLWRLGYRTKMIARPTYEAAPRRAGVWLRQRTRWFKGWLQTTFVHSRKPVAFLQSMSTKAMLVTTLFLVGTIVSALLHPFFLASAIWSLVGLLSHDGPTTARQVTAWVDWSTVVLSYAAFGALCWRSTALNARASVWLSLLLIPIYWLGFSLAAWRAVWQLLTNPFLWEKTPHTHEDDEEPSHLPLSAHA
ncbi:MAG: glycosyltransferase family 2 protein [Pseudomonadota bacterium]